MNMPKSLTPAPRFVFRYIIPAVVLFLYILFAVFFSKHTPIYNPFSSGAGGEINYDRAQVASIDSQAYSPSTFQGLYSGSQTVTVRMESGAYKGQTFTFTNALNYDTNFLLHQGQEVVVSINTATSGKSVTNVYLYAPYRLVPLCVLVLLFLIILCLIGGKRGFRAILGIGFTLTTVFFIFIPMLIRGVPTILATLLVVIATSCVTLFLVGGFGRKSLAAVLGTTAGIVISIIILLIFSGVLQVSGFTSSDTDALLNIAGNCRLQVHDLFFAGTVISSLGAVMDIAISIATSVNEVHLQNPDANVKGLFQSGLNVGRDMMGTMVNTLLLAYAGASVVAFIEMYSYQTQMAQLLNSNAICMEILEAICGSLAVILTVPMVSYVSARLLINTKSE